MSDKEIRLAYVPSVNRMTVYTTGDFASAFVTDIVHLIRHSCGNVTMDNFFSKPFYRLVNPWYSLLTVNLVHRLQPRLV